MLLLLLCVLCLWWTVIHGVTPCFRLVLHVFHCVLLQLFLLLWLRPLTLDNSFGSWCQWLTPSGIVFNGGLSWYATVLTIYYISQKSWSNVPHIIINTLYVSHFWPSISRRACSRVRLSLFQRQGVVYRDRLGTILIRDCLPGRVVHLDRIIGYRYSGFGFCRVIKGLKKKLKTEIKEDSGQGLSRAWRHNNYSMISISKMKKTGKEGRKKRCI